MLRNWVCSSVFFVGLCVIPFIDCVIAQSQRNVGQPETAFVLMEAKLANSEQLLRGLVTEDFDMIIKASRKLRKIAEAAHWPSSIDEVYQHHSFEFRRQCDKLIANANKKDVQAAHFSFLQLTTSCVDCHEYVRPRFKIDKKPGGAIQLIPTEWNRDKIQRPEPDNGTTTELNALQPTIRR